MWIIIVTGSFGPTFVYDEKNAGRAASKIKIFDSEILAIDFALKHWPETECATKIERL
jgi:hypothetical protein